MIKLLALTKLEYSTEMERYIPVNVMSVAILIH